MNIRHVGQGQSDDWVEFYIIVNPKTGERKVYFKDNQNLGKQCAAAMEKIAPGAGQVGHNHQDWNAGGKDPFARVKEKVVER